MKIKIVLLSLFFLSISYSQPNEIIEQIKSKLDKVDDYSAKINIAVNMDFIKMPKSKAEIFFKKPDKFKLNSSSFAILPKAGIDFNPQRILSEDIMLDAIGDTLIDDLDLVIYKITPNIDSSKFDSAILLVDENNLLIKELMLTPNNNSKVITKFFYEDHADYALPSKISVSLDFSEVDVDENKKRRRRDIPDSFKGEITITYSDYKVNNGIDDKIFEDENDKK